MANMSGEEAKTVLRGMIGLMSIVNMQKPDPNFGAVLCKFSEAVEISCAAIDMVEDRLDIDGGDKNE